MTETNVQEAARRLREAAKNKEVCEPVRNLIGTQDLAQAYAIQEINSAIRIQEGAQVAGVKIGLTAPVVQKQLGVDQPDFGMLWNDKEVLNGGEISVEELMQAKAEAEIAFVLGSDLDKEYLTTVDILSAVDYVLPSIEIVGSRIANWDIKITDTIADNASASHWTIGHRPVKLDQLDLINCKMKMYNHDQLVSEGVGKACLGSPINAVLWLAKKMKELGKPLKAGQVILSGALGPMVNINVGDHFRVEIEGLGEVSASFTK